MQMSVYYNWWFVFHVCVWCLCFMLMFHTHVSCSCFMFHARISCLYFMFMFRVYISCFCLIDDSYTNNRKHITFANVVLLRLMIWVSCLCFVFMFHVHVSYSYFMFMFHVYVRCLHFMSMFHICSINNRNT